MKLRIFSLFILCLLYSSSYALDYQELNSQIHSVKAELEKTYVKAQADCEAPSKETLELIAKLRSQLHQLQENQRLEYLNDANQSEEGYAYWDQGEATLSSLVMEYGSNDFLYVIPFELSSMKIHLYSGIPLPKESWNEMLELMLMHNGIGVKTLNTYAKQLYILKHDPLGVHAVSKSPKDLQVLPDNSRVFYLFTPLPEQVSSVCHFFERFSDPKQTTIHAIGSTIAVVSSKENILKLLQLYQAVWQEGEGKVVKVVNLQKVQVEEAEKILKTFFIEPTGKTPMAFYHQKGNELEVLALPQGALVLVGDGSVVHRAEQILNDLESQLENPSEMTIFWYTCRHSNPEDLAQILEQVYSSLTHTQGMDLTDKAKPQPQHPSPSKATYKPVNPVNPPPFEPGQTAKSKSTNTKNFIVDPKTGSILMVVRCDELIKIKTLLKRLDVPKKMVQIDVLLVEKKFHDQKQSGINLLNIGTPSSNKRSTGISFSSAKDRKGIFNFLFSRPSGAFPAFDLIYQFLMSQDDLKVNANPSVIAINQTAAMISVVDEISINNGAVQADTIGPANIEKSFTRAQFGITISMTPTIHLPDPDADDKRGFITLETNVTFDSMKQHSSDRPDVTRRHIQNEVRIADGETIILGGLRRKSNEIISEKIPFLGEIPGIGKLFSSTKLSDDHSEMIIFITPKIIKDPVEDLRRIRTQQLQTRPGDIPEFLECLEEARSKEKERLFADSIQLLFEPI